MRERAAEVGGHLEIRSQLGSGTQIIVTFPWQAPDQTDDLPLADRAEAETYARRRNL